MGATRIEAARTTSANAGIEPSESRADADSASQNRFREALAPGNKRRFLRLGFFEQLRIDISSTDNRNCMLRCRQSVTVKQPRGWGYSAARFGHSFRVFRQNSYGL